MQYLAFNLQNTINIDPNLLSKCRRTSRIFTRHVMCAIDVRTAVKFCVSRSCEQVILGHAGRLEGKSKRCNLDMLIKCLAVGTYSVVKLHFI